MNVPPDSDSLTWRDDIDAAEWDRALAALSGHPLQSSLWGNARRESDGINDRRWMALRHGEPIWLARIEERKIPGGWIGWVPRGPTGHATSTSDLPRILEQALGRDGMHLLVTDRWSIREEGQGKNEHFTPRTIWIDLTCGLEILSRNLDKQWRYGVNRARRHGVVVDATASASDIEHFSSLCEAVAKTKGFDLGGSAALMEKLLAHSSGHVEAQLFLGRFEGMIAAGAFVLRCGRSLHYFWGATDRAATQSRAGEAVQWAAIEWGVKRGCTRYDLEGIDPVGNPGTYAFKKKMGGQETTLTGKRYYPLGVRGRVLAWADRNFR